MQFLILFISGCITGIMLSAPIGPANILCLENTFKSGPFSGFVTGLGAAIGDFLYIICVLFFGIIILDSFEKSFISYFKYVSIAILFIFALISFIKGFKQYHDPNASQLLSSINHLSLTQTLSKKTNYYHYASAFFSTFILTVTNPLTLVGIVSSVTAVGLGSGILTDTPLTSAIFYSIGALAGSLSWWYGLTYFACYFAHSLTMRHLCFINYFGSILMISISIYIYIYV